jgi:hypothetical protein
MAINLDQYIRGMYPRYELFIRIEEFAADIAVPMNRFEFKEYKDREGNVTVQMTVHMDMMSFQDIAPDKRIDVTPMRRPKLRLMVDHRGERPGELGVVPLTKLEVSTTREEYTAHATLHDWYAAIDPPKKKEPTTEEALLAAVNESRFLAIMAWRDWMIENDYKEEVINGLNWLINYRKYPAEGTYYTESPLSGAPRKVGHYWLVDATGSPWPLTPPNVLPQVIRESIEDVIVTSRIHDSVHCDVKPKMFNTVHEAFWSAAVAIGKNINNLHEKKEPPKPPPPDDDDDYYDDDEEEYP